MPPFTIRPAKNEPQPFTQMLSFTQLHYTFRLFFSNFSPVHNDREIFKPLHIQISNFWSETD
jgi:hypothetical protein